MLRRWSRAGLIWPGSSVTTVANLSGLCSRRKTSGTVPASEKFLDFSPLCSCHVDFVQDKRRVGRVEQVKSSDQWLFWASLQSSCGLCWRQRKSKIGCSSQSFGLCSNRCAIVWGDWLSHRNGLSYLSHLITNILKTKAPPECVNQVYTCDQQPCR